MQKQSDSAGEFPRYQGSRVRPEPDRQQTKKGECRFDIRLRGPCEDGIDGRAESGSNQRRRIETSSRRDQERSKHAWLATWHAASRTGHTWRQVRSRSVPVLGSKPGPVRGSILGLARGSILGPELARGSILVLAQGSKPVPVHRSVPVRRSVPVHRPERMRCGDRTTCRSNRRRSWGPRSNRLARTSRTKQLTSFPPPKGCERV